MVSSLIKSLPLIVVIMTAGVDGLQDWGVNYSPSHVCALNGSTVTISCTVKYPDGHEIKSVFWAKPTVGVEELPDLCLDPENRGRVQCLSEDKDTSSITLTAVTEADKHIYYCRFTTDKEDGKWTGIPGVQLDVTGLQVETHQSVKERDSVTLTCKSSCSLPEQTTFIWLRNTLRLTGRSGKQLHLQSVSRYDAGNYRCGVTGHQHLISPPVYLKVEWDNSKQDWGVNYSPSHVCALKGSTVNISCTLTHPRGYVVKTAFWAKPTVGFVELPDLCLDSEKRGRVQCNSEYYKDTSSITLTAVTEADKHIYYCRFITNKEDGKWTGIPGAQLDVTDLQVETHQSVKEGDSVTLTCKSSCSLPEQTTFIWLRNTERLTDRSEKQLHLQSVSRSDAGNYQCEIRRNNHHLISPAVYLNVEYPPQNVSVWVSGSGVIVEGDSVTLNCISDSNPPALNFSWFKEKETSAVGSGQSFSISSFSSSFSGRFYCEAQNKYGSRRSESVSLFVSAGVQNTGLLAAAGIGAVLIAVCAVVVVIKIIRRKAGDTGVQSGVSKQDNSSAAGTNQMSVSDSGVQNDLMYTSIDHRKPQSAGDEDEVQYATVQHHRNAGNTSVKAEGQSGDVRDRGPADSARSDEANVIYSRINVAGRF